MAFGLDIIPPILQVAVIRWYRVLSNRARARSFAFGGQAFKQREISQTPSTESVFLSRRQKAKRINSYLERTRNGSTWRLCLLAFAAIGLLKLGQAAAADDDPAIAKDSIQVTAFTFNSYRKNVDVWSWAPILQFRVNGPSASGSQLYAEFTVPGAPSVKFDCKTEHVERGSQKMWCGGRDMSEERGSTYTGMVNFAIRVRNELSGSGGTLFTGRIKVAKVHSSEHGPKFGNHFDYYVDQDWNLPIGYVFLTPAPVVEWKRPQLNVAFWIRGDSGPLQPHFFYQGNEVGRIFLNNSEMGKAICAADIENGTTHPVDDSLPQKARWSRVVCLFPNVLGWDKSGKRIMALPGETGSRHLLSGNSGDY